MNLFAVFAFLFIIVLAALVLLDGFAAHMGNPTPTNWWKVIFWAALAALVATGLIDLVAGLFR